MLLEGHKNYIINYHSEPCDKNRMDCYGTENSTEVCYSLENCYKKKSNYPVIIKSLNFSYFCPVCTSKSLIEDFCHVSVPSPELQHSTVI